MNVVSSIITWVKAARAPFFIASIIPVSLGGTIAYSHGIFDLTLFLTVLAGIIMVQAGADFLDDYYDFKTGNIANKSRQFFKSPLLEGNVKLEHILYAGLICLAIAVIIALYLTITVGYVVLVLAAIGGFIGSFYTAPPFRLGYRGFGEIVIFLAFGPLLVTGTYYVLVKNLTIEPIIASIPLGILIASITYVGAIFDYQSDKATNKKNIVVLLQPSKAIKFLSLLLLVAYFAVIFGVIFQIMPLWTLITIITTPIALSLIKTVSKYSDSSAYTPAVSRIISIVLIFGVLMCISYLIPV